MAKLQPESISQEGIAQLPAFKEGGSNRRVMDTSGGILSALSTAAGLFTKLGMAIPSPITLGLGIAGGALNYAGAPKGMTTGERIGRATLPFGKTIFPGPSQDGGGAGGGLGLGSLDFDRAKAEGRGTFNPNAGSPEQWGDPGKVTISDLRRGKTALSQEEQEQQMAQFLAQQERGLARLHNARKDAAIVDNTIDVNTSSGGSLPSGGPEMEAPPSWTDYSWPDSPTSTY
jgi:hypothetical protein